MSFTELDTNISMDLREQQRAFLITYSQADIRKMPSCLCFIEITLEAFNFTSSSRRVVQWACCMEEHADGGNCYHLAILFLGSCCWLAIKNAVHNRLMALAYIFHRNTLVTFLRIGTF